MTDLISLSAEFPEADEARWRALVDKAMKGAPFDRLVSRTEHGLEVRPLYRATDWATAQGDPNLPGAAPWLRGFEAGRDVYLPWDIRQVVSHPNVGAAHDQIIEALEGGVSSIELRLDPAGQSGVAVQTAADVAALLKDVKLDLAPVALDAGETAGAAAAALLAAAMPDDARAAARIDFNIDVASTASDALGAASASIARTFPAARAARADARPVHEAGGTEVQELAVLAGLTAKAMRAMISAGLSPDEAANALLLTVATGPDILVEMAKLRAARRITGRIAEAFGADAALLRLQAVTSRRMLAARDAWVNLLRNTSACFSAGVGGADVATVRNFTDAMGEPGKLARRMARNTQIMAQEESSLGRVIDPAGGVWSIEALADEIATAAWKRFQVMETAGGVDAGPTADALKSEIAASADARRKAVRRRKEWITGVNDFPLLGETAPDVDPVERPTEPPKTTGASIAAERSCGGRPAPRSRISSRRSRKPSRRWALRPCASLSPSRSWPRAPRKRSMAALRSRFCSACSGRCPNTPPASPMRKTSSPSAASPSKSLKARRKPSPRRWPARRDHRLHSGLTPAMPRKLATAGALKTAGARRVISPAVRRSRSRVARGGRGRIHSRRR
ncbi:MAG: methylmalonyl-CoA mutase family protein [Hyphomonadaceae bacterium]